MEPNIYTNDQTYNQPPQPTQKGRHFNASQMSLLSKSMLAAGIGFILIALIGLGFYFVMVRTQVDITLMWILSIVLIMIAMILSMVMTSRLRTASKGLVFSVWGIYIIAEGIGFGILFAAFEAQFPGHEGFFYLMLVFAAGGLAFLISALIGRRLSVKATVALGKWVLYMSIGFMVMMLVSFIAMIIISATSSGGFASGFASSGLYLMIVALSTILFFCYMLWDMAMISKMQSFIDVNDNRLAFNLVMLFGWRLLVDLVGLVWNIAILVLRFAR